MLSLNIHGQNYELGRNSYLQPWKPENHSLVIHMLLLDQDKGFPPIEMLLPPNFQHMYFLVHGKSTPSVYGSINKLPRVKYPVSLFAAPLLSVRGSTCCNGYMGIGKIGSLGD